MTLVQFQYSQESLQTKQITESIKVPLYTNYFWVNQEENILFLCIKTTGIQTYLIVQNSLLQFIQRIDNQGVTYQGFNSLDNRFIFLADGSELKIYQITKPNTNKDLINVYNKNQCKFYQKSYLNLVSLLFLYDFNILILSYGKQGLQVYQFQQKGILKDEALQSFQHENVYFGSMQYIKSLQLLIVCAQINGLYFFSLQNFQVKKQIVFIKIMKTNIEFSINTYSGLQTNYLGVANGFYGFYILNITEYPEIIDYQINPVIPALKQIKNQMVSHVVFDSKFTFGFYSVKYIGVGHFLINNKTNIEFKTFFRTFGGEYINFDNRDIQQCYLYIADGKQGITIINCTNIQKPYKQSSIPIDGWATYFLQPLQNDQNNFNYLIVNQLEKGLINIINIENKENPVVVSTFQIDGDSSYFSFIDDFNQQLGFITSDGFFLSDNFAVLVAGSNGYWNYRHQSDLCHSYQLLLQRGYKAQNIITFSYNDVAPDSENPFPNQLFNKPTYDKPGVDVNKGCVIDYKGDDVKPSNYLAVLQGNSTAVKGVGTGRVLKSGANDQVFLSFFDHGAPGIVAFPNEDLYATDLQKALTYMFEKKMYKQLVYYMEACESGSMFQNLPKNLNIYAVTAANEAESSYAAYCDKDAFVGGKDIGSCLGDLFSINWMEDTDNSNDETYTLQQQFEKVKKLTDQSHVMQYGDLTWSSKTPISVFLGHHKKGETVYGSLTNFLRKNFPKVSEKYEHEIIQNKGVMDSRLVKLQYLTNKFRKDPSDINFANLNVELHSIKYFNDRFNELKKKFMLTGTHFSNTNFDCYKPVLQSFKQKCGVMTESSYNNYKYLYELCAIHETKQALDIVSKMC